MLAVLWKGSQALGSQALAGTGALSRVEALQRLERKNASPGAHLEPSAAVEKLSWLWKSRLFQESSQRELKMEPSIPEDEDFLPPTVPSLEKTEEVWRLDP